MKTLALMVAGLAGVLLAPGARAQGATALSLADVTGTYSHAVDLVARLTTTADGQGVGGADVEFALRDEAGSTRVDLGHLATNPDGQASVRVPLVNGCPLWGSLVITAGTDAAPVTYVLEARFTGDAQHGPATRSAVLRVDKESAQVTLVRGTSGELGQPLTITASVVDGDGDAPCDRSAATGNGPTTVAGRTLGFFLDYVGDGDWSDPREFLGTAVTARTNPQEDATASVTADLTPVNNQPHAGRLTRALQVQLPANDALYLPSTAQADLVVDPAPVDPARTDLEADPSEAQAGGTAIQLRATLRDTFANPLLATAPAHDVAFHLVGDSLGAQLSGGVRRDPDTGKYEQSLLGASRKGTVTVRATVDGQDANRVKIRFTGLLPLGPCACVHVQQGVPAGALLALAWVLARRRGRAP